MNRRLATQVKDAIVADLVTRYVAKYPEPAQVARIHRAAEIVQRGGCQAQADGTWQIAASNGTETYHQVNGHCPCPDAQWHQGVCKHRFAKALRVHAAAALCTARYATWHGPDGRVEGAVWQVKDATMFVALPGTTTTAVDADHLELYAAVLD